MQTAAMDQSQTSGAYSQITYEVDGDLAVIMLNRPERLNAWTYPMMGEMFRAVATANADASVGAIVLSGTGRGFCAGADVNEVFASGSDSDASRATTSWRQVSRNCPVRLSRWGSFPNWHRQRFLARRCGWGAASDLMLSGRAVDAAEAFRLRLVDEIAEPEELLAAAKVRARSYAANSETALRFVKELLTQNACETDLVEVQRREGALLAKAFKSPEHSEAIAAFTEKRAPKFR
jgi:enoyl-CoA hydratase/carnithine racemase